MFLIILIILLSIKTPLSSNLHCSFDNIHTTYKDNDLRIIQNFDNLDELKFNCSKPIKMSILGLKPKKQIILDKSLNLTGLKIQPNQDNFAIMLENFKGFNLKSNPFEDINFTLSVSKLWSISFSNFEFYEKENRIENICDEHLLKEILPKNQFNSFLLTLDSDTKFSENTCPIIFWNIHLRILNIRQISFSLIEKNILGFKELSRNISKAMNSTIWLFKVGLYHTDLNSRLLNEFVFSKLTVLEFTGQITKIQEDLFKSIKNLRLLRFRMQNIQKIFIRNNKWLNSINFDLNIDIKNLNEVFKYNQRMVIMVIQQAFYNLTFYTYPEQDFCHFKNFPHNHLVLPRLMPSFKTKCSCTEIFLIQYSYLYGQSIKYFTGSIPSSYYLFQYYQDIQIENTFTHCYNNTFLETIKNCNFKRRLDLCSIQIVTYKKENFYFYMNDWNKFSEYAHFIFSTYINLIFSLIAIFLCLLILITLSNKRKITKEFEKTYSFIKIYTCLNILFISVRLIRLIANCSFQDIICLTIYQKSESYQYVKIIFIRLIGNLFQTAANLTQIIYTLSRYIIITNSKSIVLTTIHKVSFKKFILIILILALAMNLHIFFEFSIQKETFSEYQLKLFSANNFSKYKQEPFDDYKENFRNSEYLILDIFQYIKLIFSDLFYIISSFLIDFVLLIFVRKKMQKKVELTTMSTFVASLNLVVLATVRIKNNNDTKKRINKLKNRITTMIILNGLNFLVLRFPLALLSFYGFIFRFDNQEHQHKPNTYLYIICRYYKFCTSLEEIFYFIYLNSYIIQFFIFLKLDKNFKESFRDLVICGKKMLNKNN